MHLPSRAGGLCASALALALAAALPACGGNVVVDPAGEGGGTTTTSPTTTTPTPTTTTITPTTTTTTMTPTPTGICDGTGMCLDGGASCVQCAIAGPCAVQFNACVSNPECPEVDECISSCPDPSGCVEMCAAQHPQGFPDYQALVECAICQQCAFDCAGQFPWPCN